MSNCIHIYIYIHTYIHVCAFVRARARVCRQYIYIYIYAYIYISVCVCVCVEGECNRLAQSVQSAIVEQPLIKLTSARCGIEELSLIALLTGWVSGS